MINKKYYYKTPLCELIKKKTISAFSLYIKLINKNSINALYK